MVKLNRKMKKILFYIVVAFLSVSCFKNINYTSKYHLFTTFEYEGGDVVWRADSTYYLGSEYIGLGWANDLVYAHRVDEHNEFLGGFRLSSLTGLIREGVDEAPESDSELDKTWRVHAPKEKNNYGVFWFGSRVPLSHIQFLTSMYGTCTMGACYVCNTAKVAEEVQNKFERGDKLTLKAIGYLNSQQTDYVEIALADYTLVDKNGEPKDSIVSNWTMLDLTKLGSVNEVRFEMSSGNKSIPHYFCLDDLICLIDLAY